MWLKQNLVLILLLAAGFPAVRSDCHDRAQVILEPVFVANGGLDEQEYSEEVVVVLDEEEPEPVLIQTSEFVSTPEDEDETDGIVVEEMYKKKRTVRALPMTTTLLRSLSQECDGIALRWVSPPIPFSLTYHNTNPDFKHYNIYRELSYFTSVVGLTPLASGKDHLELQKIQTNKYIDKFPPTGITLYYAVTVVDHMGLETVIVLPKQISFLGSIEKTGIDPIRLIPNSLKGDVLHHSLAYNHLRNEYMVAFDLDVNNDGSPDHVYALRVNGSGHMDQRILNVTVAMVTTQQGRPSVAFNPITQHYLIAFQMSAPSLFGGSSVIVGQRVYGHKTDRLHTPYVIVKGGGNSPTVEPNLIYNPATGGFVMTMMLISPPKTAFAIFLKSDGVPSYIKRLFGNEVFEAQVFMDPMNQQVYFVYQVARSTVTLSANQTNAHRSLHSYPYLILVTRTNATGTSDPSVARNLVGFTHEKDASLAGYFDQNNGWLTVFWNNRENGKMRINSSNLFGVHGVFQREDNPHSCPTHTHVRNPAPCFLPHNNGHMLLWEQGSQLGGFLVKEDTFYPVLGEQQHAKLLYNHHEKRAFVVYKQKIGGDFVLYARNIHPGSHFSCRVPCKLDEKCAMLDVCAPRNPGLVKTMHTCAKHNGGCSHICHPCTICSLGVTCSCPMTHALSLDKMKCFHKAHKPDVSLLYSSLESMWSASIYHKEKRTTFTKVPIQGKVIVAFFYNKHDKYLYYGDVLDRKIYRAFLDGSNKMTLINNQLAEAMIVEPDAKHLFWTDVTLGKIFRCSLDGTNRMTFVSSLDKPRALALHHPKKWLFWTTWGAAPKIERINMDGSGRKTLFDTGLGWPNGLAIHGSFLYWTDAMFHHIEMSHLDGGNRHVLARKISPHPFALAIAGHSLFWTDWSDTIYSMNKSIPFSSPEVLISGIKKPFSIQTYDEAAVIKASFCSDLGAPIDGKRYPFPGIGGKYRIGDKVLFTCNPGFVHVGSIERHCLSTGMWSGMDIHCKARFCRDPGAPIDGKRYPLPGTGGTYKMGDKVTMTCNPGFILHGSNERYCLSTLKWTGLVTQCVASFCGDPGVPSDGNRYPLPSYGGKYKMGDKVMLTCNPGFLLHGANERYCLSSGKWTGVDTQCKGRPVFTNLPKNQTVDVGSTAVLRCSVKVKHGLKPNIKWEKNGKIIPPSTIKRYVQVKSTGVFFINNALVEDTGTYTCVATNAVGDVRASMYLRVKGYAVSYCGKVTFSKAKMAGVHQAVHGSVPWQVLLWDKQANRAFCEGSLLNERYVITAAHCLNSKLMLPSIEVRLGKDDLKKVEKSEQKFDIDKVYIHPHYNQKTLDSDIALIHLKAKVVMTEYVKPVCLPVTKSDLTLLKSANKLGRISGWGKAQPSISMTCPLQEVLLPFVSQVTCKRNHRQYLLTPNMFCAGSADSKLDMCHGDSGSPMTMDNMKTGRSILVGVMSWRKRVCAVGGKYGVYTKVQNYLDWINTRIEHA